MENLKTFLGDAYHDGMTIEEIDTFLEGKKYTDLSSGNYVSKEKYERLETKYKDASTKATEYDSIKAKYDEYVAKEKDATLKEYAKTAKIKEEFIEFALSKVEGSENVEEALKEFAKKNPHFTTGSVRVSTNPRLNGNEPQNKYADIDAEIRRLAGR